GRRLERDRAARRRRRHGQGDRSQWQRREGPADAPEGRLGARGRAVLAGDRLTVDERLVVGLVRRVHGLRGVLRVEVLTDHPELRFAPGASLYPEGGRRALTVDEASPVADGPGWWVRFRERPDRNAAEPLVGTYLEALVPATGADDAGTVWWHEVV